MRKKIGLCLALVFCTAACVPLSACGGTGGSRFDNYEVDENKTQLYVEFFDGGVGKAWLTDGLAARFEKKYEGVSLEAGKEGVQVVPVPSVSSAFDNIANSDTSVYFSESCDYFTYAAQGVFLDISDIVKSTAEGDSVTIESKLSKSHKDGLTAIDGKYYALPHYEIFFSAMYDVDLFEAEGLYYAKDGGFVTSQDDERSVGPDGVANTGDDGMPVTYDEFFALCDYMLSKGITPFIWTGESTGYMNKFLSAIAANYGGEEDWSANFNYSGKAKIITDYTTLQEEEVEITAENGYLLSQQASKYQALRFLERILSTSEYYHEDSLLKTYSNIDAQEQFIYSKLDNEPIAMIIEGSFWSNEAHKNGIFERSIRDKGDKAKNRNFGIMSLPLANDKNAAIGKQSTLADIGISYAFINANVKTNEMLLNLSKDFLQFAYSDQSLIEFTTMTSMTKAMNYSLSTQQYDALSKFGQQIWDLKKSSVVTYELSDSEIFLNNTRIFNYSTRFTSIVDGDSYLLPINALSNKQKDISALDYFKGMKVSENDWKY